MEIERKFLVELIPENYQEYPVHFLEQAYLCRQPVVRVRKEAQDGNAEYILTYKSEGLMVREEYNMPLNKESYEHLKAKADGRVITKKRYQIPSENGLIIELDVFEGELAGLLLAEVEFPDEETAQKWQPPEWFGREVTYEKTFHNSNLSRTEEECQKK